MLAALGRRPRRGRGPPAAGAAPGRAAPRCSVVRRPAGPRRAPRPAGGGRPGRRGTRRRGRRPRRAAAGSVCAVRNGHVARPARRRVPRGSSSASRPVSSAATGPPYRGSSRVNVTGRWSAPGRRRRRPRPRRSRASSAQVEQGAAGELDRRLVGAVQPGGDAAGQDHRAERLGRIRHGPSLPHCRCRPAGRLGP